MKSWISPLLTLSLLGCFALASVAMAGETPSQADVSGVWNRRSRNSTE